MPTTSPPRPAEWKKTIGDLVQEMNAGLHTAIGQPEIDWAREYERSLISDGLRYPQKGDVYESLIDQPIRFMTAWFAPYTGGGESTIYAGERIWIDSAPIDENPSAFMHCRSTTTKWKGGWSPLRNDRLLITMGFI